jgi:siroheme synthase
LPARLADDDMHPPAIIIIGDVVGLRSRLDWFGH